MGYRGFNRIQLIDCCKDCEERFLACHDYCQKYKTAKAEWESRRENIRSAKRKSQAIDSYQVSAIRQMRKGKR